MESGRKNGSNVNVRNSPSTNSGEEEQFMPSAITTSAHDQTYFQSEFNHTHSLAEKGDGRPINSHLQAHPSKSQNPFLVMNDDTNNTTHGNGNESHQSHTLIEQGHGNMPSYEARTHPTNPYVETHVSSSSQQLVEPNHSFSATEQGQQYSMASGNLGTDKKPGSSVSSFPPTSESSTQNPMHSNSANASTKTPPKSGKYIKLDLESSDDDDDDIPISSFPKHGQQSSVVSTSSSNGSERQNPPVQVMERPEDTAATSKYKFPSHVFARHKSNNQWSTASNESLFSIQMGTSFSNEVAWYTKSGELEKSGDMNLPVASGPSNQPPLPPQLPPTKFIDISQSTAEQHKGSKVTEEKAAETMREVLLENSINSINKNNTNNVGLTTSSRAPSIKRLSSINDHSHHSDGSTRSFAFKSTTEGEKNYSSKRGGEEKRKQQVQSEPQTPKEAPDAADQQAKEPPNPPPNKWLSCFTCCT